jgi:DnaK suppressor protein
MALKKMEVAKFKKELESLRAQMLQSLKGSTQEVKKPDETGAYTQHQADKGTDDFDRTISLELTSQEFNILKYIDRALEKINEDTYGICDITGKEIPKARLEAVPYATMTVEAQDKLEKGLL